MGRHRPKLFFKASLDAFEEMTRIFDFLWPTAAAMWNLRWQVTGYLSARPTATAEELRSRFVTGSGVHGVNFKRTCVELTWEEQQSTFAAAILPSIFAVYEGWAEELKGELKSAAGAGGLHNSPDTIADTLRSLCGATSPMMKETIYPFFKCQRLYNCGCLQNWMRCYRYFKECRNCLIHRGGRADKRLVDSYAAFAQVATTSDLGGVSEVPRVRVQALGDRVRLELRGVVGLSDIVQRLIVTCDAELTQSKAAECVLLHLWHSKRTRRLQLHTSETAPQQVLRALAQMGIPTERRDAPTVDLSQLVTFARRHDLAT